MFISNDIKLEKWSKVLLVLSCFQLIISLALLIPASMSAKNIHTIAKPYSYNTEDNRDSVFYKSGKVIAEITIFILFEFWKLWLAFDGILKSNIRTVWASSCFTLFSWIFSILMIVESVNWGLVTEETGLNFDDLVAVKKFQLLSQNLFVPLSCFLFVMIAPLFYVTIKVSVDFGWDVYKKIGANITIQKMYIIVQWFSLGLKIDIFFEIIAYALYLYYGFPGLHHEESISIYFTMLATVFLIVPSFILSRYAISMENKIMMILFIVFQLWITIFTIIIMMKITFLLKDWYAFTAYCAGCLASSLGTAMIAIVCLLNFNKGLKEFVHWSLFGKKRLRRQSTFYDNLLPADIHHHDLESSKRAGIPIDEE